MYAPRSLINAKGVQLGADFLETTGAWTANSAYFCRVFLQARTLFNRCGLFIVTQSGNLDVGIYADDGTGQSPGTRLVSSGSTAAGASGSLQAVTIADTILDPGCYWIAFATDNGSLSTPKSTTAAPIWKHRAQSKASSFPLPSSVSTLTTNAALHGAWIGNL